MTHDPDLEAVAALRGAVLRLGRRLRYQTLGDGDLSEIGRAHV